MSAPLPRPTDDAPFRPSVPLTVLVVDDDADMRGYLVRCLQGLGRVMEATDGLDALDVLAAEPVGLVISDLVMPRMDGLALYRAIRDDPQLGSLLVLIISGEPAPDRALDPGLGFLGKPFNARTLRRRIADLIGSGGVSRTA